MSKKLTMLGVALLLFGSMAWAAQTAAKATKAATAEKTYYVTVSDSNCGLKHAQPSAEAAACVAKCVTGGAKYVAVYRGKVYQLTPQDKFADFAGKRAKVTGTRSGDTITASNVEALKSGTKSKAKKAAGASGR
ncbi:MAG TPA: hypothetical protein VJV74_13420 [Terriglobia bacterium]|nr:hypothetical protein [Terriglobia bacterium]